MILTKSKSVNLIIQTLAVLFLSLAFLAFAFEIKASEYSGQILTKPDSGIIIYGGNIDSAEEIQVSGPILTKPDSGIRIYNEEAVLEKPKSDIIISDPKTTSNEDKQIQQIIGEAKVLTPIESSKVQDSYKPTLDELTAKYGITRERNKELSLGHYLLAKIYSGYSWEAELKKEGLYEAMIFFITYDYGTTADLGAGERAGVIDSWKTSKELNEICIPESISDWEDVIKIANGRWPNVLPKNDYIRNKESVFQQIYLRNPDYENANDEAAMMIITYGLRPQPRNVNSENEAIGFFKSIFDKDPINASDWDIVRAIAYSGATR